MRTSIGTAKLGFAALALVAAAGTAFADGYEKKSLKDAPAEAPKRELQITANVAGTTDYVFRGFSQSAEGWTVQAGVDLTYKWFYAGVWSSGIDFGKDGNNKDVAHVEMDWYAGIKPVIGRFTFDFGAIYYTYPRARDSVLPLKELDYVELKAGVSMEAWKDATIGATVFFSPNYTNDTGEVVTVEGAFSQVLPAIGQVTPTFSALIGYQSGNDARYKALVGNGANDYVYWNAGMTLGFGDRFSIDLRYWDTNIKSDNAAAGFADGFCTGRTFGCDERFVGTAKVTF